MAGEYSLDGGMLPRTPLLAAVLLIVACATPRQSWQEMQTPEVFVDLLPRSAVLEVDGRVLGPGSRTVPLPDLQRRYRFKASAAGFQPMEMIAEGKKLAGARANLLLRPSGFGTARPLDAGDPGSLAQAALVLLRAGRLDDARDYADYSLELAEVPLAHRVLGAVYEKQGDRRRAAQEYSAYLALAPEAPDARIVAEAVARARGDLTIPGAGAPAP
jgi:tetratricopeptide (TPR) repeat protein